MVVAATDATVVAFVGCVAVVVGGDAVQSVVVVVL